MIFVTGDLHGGNDFPKLNTRNFPEQKEMTKSDYLIICGDFGCVWDGSEEDEYWCDLLEKRNYTTLWVDGNHENFDMVNKLPVKEWNGGLVHEVRPSVLHLMRGQIFDIYGASFLAMGGATSHDKWARKTRVSWWPEEEITSQDMRVASRNLGKRNWCVDYVLSHSAPASIETQIASWYEHGPTSWYLNDLYQNIKFKHWYFGHYHIDMEVNDQFTALYDRVLRLEEV